MVIKPICPKLQLIYIPISCHFPTAYTHTIFIHMIQFPLSSFSSYRSCSTMSSANHHLLTTVHLVIQFIPIFPEWPELAALPSLVSVVTQQKQSVFTIQPPIRSPVLLILQNVLFKFVNHASTVLEPFQLLHFQVQPQVKISLFIHFVLISQIQGHASNWTLASNVL